MKKILRERIDSALNKVLVPWDEIPYGDKIEESIKEERLPISVFASEAIANDLVGCGPYFITDKGKELLGKIKEVLTYELIKKNFLTVEGGSFLIKIDSFFHHGIKVCRERLFGEVLDEGMIKKRSDLWGIRTNTFLFVLMVFVINKAIEKRALIYMTKRDQ